MAQPNVILICVDEWRGDCLSSLGHPHIETPHLDELARNGVNFSKAYSATPTCVPARVALFTGQSQERHGRVGYTDGIPFAAAHPTTIQGEFKRAGYHTQAIGKMHVFPERSRLGFDDVILHDGFLHFSRQQHRQQFAMFDDYIPWLRRQPNSNADADYFDHGINCNSVVSRPWDKPEHLHPSHWLASQTIDWMYRRDPTKPFFLYLSWHRPHPPYDPPQWAFDQYHDIDPYLPVEGNWASDWEEFRRDGDYQAAFGSLLNRSVHRARAGYYGLMAHIDLQINRVKESLADFGLSENTVIAFTSDHGEMLGDHHMFRKGLPYEGSARVPLIISDAPANTASVRGSVIDHVVELRDVMPTLLDLAGIAIPDSVDGCSLAPYVRGPAAGDSAVDTQAPVREYLHGEHLYFGQNIHWLTDGKTKYIWGSAKGIEQLFDLEQDPQEKVNLAHSGDSLPLLERWRGRMVQVLHDREEGFVKNDILTPGAKVVSILKHTRERIDAAGAVPSTGNDRRQLP